MVSSPRRALRWFLNIFLGFLQRLLIAVLASGPLPKHIAFVMDGNRRYAGRKGKRIEEGHLDGFSALHRVLDICLRLKIRCVSVYAFSIENFKRSPAEVDALMNLCAQKLDELCQQRSLLEKYDVRLQLLGNRELLPQYVKDAAARAEMMTRHHNSAILNVLMPYTSRDEITASIQSTVRKVLDDGVDPETITEDDIDANLYTSLGGSPPIDIFVRTSRVKRLSDFLIWQSCENTQIQFVTTYWPEFGLKEFVPIILDYQRKVWSQGSYFS